MSARNLKWQQENKEKYLLKSRRWYEKNKHKAFAKSAKYRAAKRNACPKWVDEELKNQIANFYLEAKIKTLETGIKHEVDHIIPLKSEVVCGLHVPWNLQVLTQFVNRQKRNKLEISNG
jgi:5-methylcytosine-specific restriction endonuclease McrA